MSTNETLGQALENEGSGDQKSLCTDKVLSLTKEECAQIVAGKDGGLSGDDRSSFNRLVMTRINKKQGMTPWADVKLDEGEVDQNW